MGGVVRRRIMRRRLICTCLGSIVLMPFVLSGWLISGGMDLDEGTQAGAEDQTFAGRLESNPDRNLVESEQQISSDQTANTQALQSPHTNKFSGPSVQDPRIEKFPNVMAFVQSINQELSAFFPEAQRKNKNCFKGWDSPVQGYFLGGCSDGCKSFTDFEEAKHACETLGSSCGGLVQSGYNYELRAGNKPSPGGTHEIAHVKVFCSSQPTGPNVWHAFQRRMADILENYSERFGLNDNLKFFGPDGNLLPHLEQAKTLFLSVASYRDPNCAPTVSRAFENAAFPERLRVGVVEQNCHKNCMTGTGWAETRRIVKAKNDPDCLTEFCAGVGKIHCDAGRVRLLRLNESESYGPFFARYLASKLWQGETYVMQVDSHSHFAPGWDKNVIQQLQSTPSYPLSIISNYPPGHGADWNMLSSSSHVPEGLCDIYFGDGIMRLEHTMRSFDNSAKIPRLSLYIAAGFFVTHGRFLKDVPFDPFLPYIFMGEEIIMSARAWTNGFDVYAPTEDVVTHEYVRAESPKFWESVGIIFDNGGLHNELTDVILARIKHQLGFPDSTTDLVQDKTLLQHLDRFGLGTKRSLKDFMRITGIDVNTKRVDSKKADWCRWGIKHELVDKK